MRVFCGVAIVGVTAFLTSGAWAQDRRDQLTVLERAEAAVPGHDAIAAVDVLAPGARTLPHSHPGAMVAFVTEGTVTLEQDGKRLGAYADGESFIVPAGQVHQTFNDGSVTAKMYVTFVVRTGEAMSSPVRQ